jgi:hypothetical protein
MVPDGRSQVFKLATGCRLRATLPDVSVARLAVDTRQRGFAEEVQDPAETGSRFLRSSVLVGCVFSVNRYDIGDLAGRGVTVADSRGAVFGGDVVGERALSRSSFALAETSASFDAAVTDDPHGLFNDPTVLIPSRWLQPETGAFASTRHNSLIRSMLANVV